MKILFLTKYDSLAASSRLRAYQYAIKLDPSRYDVDVEPLLSAFYLEKKFKDQHISFFYLVYLFLKRVLILVNIQKYNVIIIHFELFPFLPPIFEWFLFKTNKKIYFDYDDAIYHNYDLSNNLLARLFLSSKIKYLMREADGVILGNNYIEKYARFSGANNILKLPTVVDINSYTDKPMRYVHEKNFTIGWIGSPSTSKYLEVVKEPLMRLGKLTPVTLYLVGASNKLNLSIDNVDIVSVKWSEKNEQKALKEFDVGIMPLFDEQWEQGKCAFKLIQYMASFLPVVSSNVGMNAEIIHNHGNGFLASSSDEWFDSLYQIFLDHDMRKIMGNNGRKLIEKDFTIQSRLSDFEKFITEEIQPLKNFPSYQEFEKSEPNDITVIIPYHNEEQSLGKTLEIIRQQTELPKEVIFVNSSSTDGGSALLNKWIEQHQGENGVHYRNIFENTDTPSSSKNVGIRLANTEWIAFMDCGLLFSNNLLESQICYINDSGLDIVSGVCDLSGTNVIDNCCLAHTYGYQRKRVVVPSTLVRKSTFKKTGLFIENRRAGYDYAWKIYLKKAALLRGVNFDAVIRYDGVNFADSFISLFKKMILYSKASTAIPYYYMPYVFAVLALLLFVSIFINLIFLSEIILIYILARWFVIPTIKSKGISVFLDHPLTIIYMLPVGIVLDFGRIVGIFRGIYFYHLGGKKNS